MGQIFEGNGKENDKYQAEFKGFPGQEEKIFKREHGFSDI
jgi:hypothetical protein